MVAFARAASADLRRCLLDGCNRGSSLRMGIFSRVDRRRVGRTSRRAGDPRGISGAASWRGRVLCGVVLCDRDEQAPGYGRWARINLVAILAALAVAVFARAASVYALSLWNPLTSSTLWGVDALLRMFGQTTIVDPVAARIGTSHFR